MVVEGLAGGVAAWRIAARGASALTGTIRIRPVPAPAPVAPAYSPPTDSPGPSQQRAGPATPSAGPGAGGAARPDRPGRPVAVRRTRSRPRWRSRRPGWLSPDRADRADRPVGHHRGGAPGRGPLAGALAGRADPPRTGYPIRSDGTAAGGWIGSRRLGREVVYRIDPGRAPVATRFRQERWVARLDGSGPRQVTRGSTRRAAWLVAKYGTYRSPAQSAAVEVALDTLLYGGRHALGGRRTQWRVRQTGAEGAVLPLAEYMLRASARLAGPYRIRVERTAAVVDEPTGFTVRVVAARSGEPIPHLPVSVRFGGGIRTRDTDSTGTVRAGLTAGRPGPQPVQVLIRRLPRTGSWSGVRSGRGPPGWWWPVARCMPFAAPPWPSGPGRRWRCRRPRPSGCPTRCPPRCGSRRGTPRRARPRSRCTARSPTGQGPPVPALPRARSPSGSPPTPATRLPCSERGRRASTGGRRRCPATRSTCRPRPVGTPWWSRPCRSSRSRPARTASLGAAGRAPGSWCGGCRPSTPATWRSGCSGRSPPAAGCGARTDGWSAGARSP